MVERKPLNTLAPGVYSGVVLSVVPVGQDVAMCFEVEGKQYFQTLRPNVPNTHRRTVKVVPSVPPKQGDSE